MRRLATRAALLGVRVVVVVAVGRTVRALAHEQALRVEVDGERRLAVGVVALAAEYLALGLVRPARLRRGRGRGRARLGGRLRGRGRAERRLACLDQLDELVRLGRVDVGVEIAGVHEVVEVRVRRDVHAAAAAFGFTRLALRFADYWFV